MPTQILNAAPMVINQHTQDLSTVPVPRAAVAIPSHLPKFYIYGQKGPTTPQIVGGVEAINMYGVSSFDPMSPYFNHSSLFMNAVAAAGGTVVAQRVIPTDAGPKANMLLSLDVLPITVPLYARDASGNYTLDITGNPIIVAGPGVPGYSVKWVVTNVATATNFLAKVGQELVGVGTQTVGTVQSTLYPMFEFVSSSIGGDGNGNGIRMWAPNSVSDQFPTEILTAVRAFPINFNMIYRSAANVSPKITPTVLGDLVTRCVLKRGAKDFVTGAQLYIGDVLLNNYQKLNDPLYPVTYGQFGNLYVYQANLDVVLGLLFNSEQAAITTATAAGQPAFTDLVTPVVASDMYMMNLANFTTSANAPYISVINAAAANATSSIAANRYTNIYAAGGSDGTMNDGLFGQLVSAEVIQYADPMSQLLDKVANPESHLYDSGYHMQTKLDMINFISQRGDTNVVLSTYSTVTQTSAPGVLPVTYGPTPQLAEADEHSMAVALRTRLQLFPESTFFGTPVVRGTIIGFNGNMLNSQYTKQVPLTLELLNMATKYMGAANGKWKNGQSFEGAPGNQLSLLTNINITFLPAQVRNVEWSVGLNWIQRYARNVFFFPAFKTAYVDDTSVLNSYVTACALGQINKINESAWREYSGRSDLTSSQLEKKVETFVSAAVKNVFDNRYVIVPVCTVTGRDKSNGFSYTLVTKLYASNMVTVQTSYIQAYRMSSYKA